MSTTWSTSSTSRTRIRKAPRPSARTCPSPAPPTMRTGADDARCLDAGLLMKPTLPAAALVVFPNTGHALNLEEPDLFNQALADFFHPVETGRWPRRDPRSQTGSILGM